MRHCLTQRKHVVYGVFTTHTAWMEMGIVSDMQVYIPELHAPPVGGSLRPGSPARSWSSDGLVCPTKLVPKGLISVVLER